MPTAHIDTFARDNLPPPAQQPDFLFDLPELQFPAQLNCATELLDRHVREGRGDRLCVQGPKDRWTYGDLWERANQIANVLVNEMGLVPGNRVLLHAPNTPMMLACWFGIVKAGGIVVATLPLLRAKELAMPCAMPVSPRPCRKQPQPLCGCTKFATSIAPPPTAWMLPCWLVLARSTTSTLRWTIPA